MNKGFTLILVLIQQLGILAFAVCLLTFSVLIFKSNNTDTSSLRQIAEDWTKQPYTELYVSKGSSACPSGYEHVFSRWWPGTINGCDCRYSAHYFYRIYTGSCDYNQTYYGCSDINALSPVYIAMIGDYSICGKPYGDSFLDSQRVNSTSGECPADYTLCNQNAANVDNMICRKDVSECPITYFQMTTTNDSLPSYKYLSVSTNLYIKYGYGDDSLPITSYMLDEGQPCMKPGDHNTNSKKTYYILESAMSSGCSYDEMSQRYTDPRYTALNSYQTTEYDLFQVNYILDELLRLPDYNGYQNYKKNYYYYIYERPTINWKLSCEQNEDQPVSRQEAYDIFSQKFVSMTNSILLVVQGSIFSAIVLVTLVMSVIYIRKDKQGQLVILFAIQEGSLVLITIFSFILFVNTKKEAQSAYSLTLNAQKVNGCSDEYANYNIEKLSINFQKAYKYSYMGFSLAVAIATYLGLLILILLGFLGRNYLKGRNTQGQLNINTTSTKQSEIYPSKSQDDKKEKLVNP